MPTNTPTLDAARERELTTADAPLPPAWDDASIADLLSDAMSNVHDMDTRWPDYAKAAVAALREEGLLPGLDAVSFAIKACCDELTDALHDRGYPSLHAEIWCRFGGFTCFIDGKGREKIPYIEMKATLDDLMALAKQRIAQAPDGNAYDAWFTWPPVADRCIAETVEG